MKKQAIFYNYKYDLLMYSFFFLLFIAFHSLKTNKLVLKSSCVLNQCNTSIENTDKDVLGLEHLKCVLTLERSEEPASYSSISKEGLERKRNGVSNSNVNPSPAEPKCVLLLQTV